MMTEQVLSLAKTAIPAVANHLWQSTVFSGLVSLMMLLLRDCRATVRYGLWLAASIKFVIPFSVLIALGGLLPKTQHAAAGRQIAWYSAIDTAGQPFSELQNQLDLSAKLKERVVSSVPAMLAAAWLCGTMTVLLIWCAKWQRVSAIRRRAISVEDGRETAILRRLQGDVNMRKRIPLLLTRELMEPGVVGVFRPVLLWPNRLSERLEDWHIEAILAHERMHVLRYDNLAASLHMFVESLFWFHPLVWWIERRLVEERERACDEAVVQWSGRPETYAEGLLRVCRFCVEAPLNCMSGITGGDLRRRVCSIMNLRWETVSVSKKLLLSAVGLASVVAPITIGVFHAVRLVAQPHGASTEATSSPVAYAVSSVRLNKALDNQFLLRFTSDGVHIENASLLMIMRGAWGLMNSRDDKFLGLPNWAKTEKFDIDAKVDSSDVEAYKTLTIAQKRRMLQAVLANRFNLKAHIETRDQPVFMLTVSKGGPKIRVASAGTDVPHQPVKEFSKGRIVAEGIQIPALVSLLTQSTDRTVLDRTGLDGRYDLTLNWGARRPGVQYATIPFHRTAGSTRAQAGCWSGTCRNPCHRQRGEAVAELIAESIMRYRHTISVFTDPTQPLM